jgi:hypothetical protein
MACVRKRRGRYVVDFRDDDGRRRWETYDTRKEADAALSKRVKELHTGTYKPPKDIPRSPMWPTSGYEARPTGASPPTRPGRFTWTST